MNSFIILSYLNNKKFDRITETKLVKLKKKNNELTFELERNKFTRKKEN